MKNQINLKINDLKDSNKISKKKFWSRIGFVCLCLLSFSMSQAQTESTKQKTSTTITKAQEKDINVQGNVTSETGKLEGVNVTLQGTSIGTATDTNGDFKFPKLLKKGDVLVFSYTGFKSRKVVIENANSFSSINLKVDMELPLIELFGSAASNKVYKSKRSSKEK